MISQHLQDKLALLPDQPGCYIMKDEKGKILYVGKAKVLKNRVRSYFHGVHDNKTTRLVGSNSFPSLWLSEGVARKSFGRIILR